MRFYHMHWGNLVLKFCSGKRGRRLELSGNGIPNPQLTRPHPEFILRLCYFWAHQF